jgi:hypothetical protein
MVLNTRVDIKTLSQRKNKNKWFREDNKNNAGSCKKGKQNGRLRCPYKCQFEVLKLVHL